MLHVAVSSSRPGLHISPEQAGRARYHAAHTNEQSARDQRICGVHSHSGEQLSIITDRRVYITCTSRFGFVNAT